MYMFRGLRVSACFTALLVVVVVINQPQMWKAMGSGSGSGSGEYCEASSCGHIHNISYPFRLHSDPPSCGNPRYELLCESNATLVLYLNSTKFFVQAINYDNYTIRLVYAGVFGHGGDNYCSSVFPPYPLTSSNFTSSDQYTLGSPLTRSLTLMSCGNRMNTSGYDGPYSSYYVDYSPCMINKSSTTTTIPSSSNYYYYVNVDGYLNASAMMASCRVDQMILVDYGHLPFSDAHTALVHGFELYWFLALCGNCARDYCFPDSANQVRCIALSACQIFDTITLLPFLALSSLHPRLAILINRIYISRMPRSDINHCGIKTVLFDMFTWFILVSMGVIGINVLLRAFCGIPFLLTISIYKWRRRHLSTFDDIEDYLKSQNNLMPIRYSYTQVKKMSRGFKYKLGEGGYGCVYKGKLRSGTFVAIKILGKTKANGQEFINEVATIGRIHHVNVVRLVGYCAERSKRALVYDFMPNGSLEKYIFPSEDEIVSLSCEQLYQISIGVTRGIEYLHRGCNIQILHFDIKPHNILLDENFTPKVSDFGLAKLYPTDDSIVYLTAARGTFGYMAPELCFKNVGGVSYKADVYSFGVLLLEMGGRRKNLNAYADHPSQIYFPSWVYNQISEGKDLEMGVATEEEREMVKKMIIVGLWCIQMKPSDRPSMQKVVEMLEGNIEVLQMPLKPNLCLEEMSAAENSQGANEELPIHESVDSIDSITLDITSA